MAEARKACGSSPTLYRLILGATGSLPFQSFLQGKDEMMKLAFCEE